MLRITISCIILAACINFQTAQADFFYNPLGSVLHNVKQVTDSVNNAITQGSKPLQNLGEDVVKLGSEIISNIPLPLATEIPKLKNENESSMTEVPRPEVTVCTKVQNDGRELLKQLISISKTCISKELESIGINIQALVHLIDMKDLKEIMNCVQHPLTSIPCLITSVPKVLPGAKEAIEAVFKLINLRTTLIPRLGMCYMSNLPAILENIRMLLVDGEKCLENVLLKVL